jgi:uncharacterized damage-inducible protein DinB
MKELERIKDELRRVHDGAPWSGSPTMDLLKNITSSQANYRASGDLHTIWEIVLHMIGWQNEVKRRLEGGSSSLPEDGDWPAASGGDEQSWKATLAAFEASHQDLVQALSKKDGFDLDELPDEPRDRELGNGVSWYVMLHGVLQHNVYHSGQIGVLRKLTMKESR